MRIHISLDKNIDSILHIHKKWIELLQYCQTTKIAKHKYKASDNNIFDIYIKIHPIDLVFMHPMSLHTLTLFQHLSTIIITMNALWVFPWQYKFEKEKAWWKNYIHLNQLEFSWITVYQKIKW